MVKTKSRGMGTRIVREVTIPGVRDPSEARGTERAGEEEEEKEVGTGEAKGWERSDEDVSGIR